MKSSLATYLVFISILFSWCQIWAAPGDIVSLQQIAKISQSMLELEKDHVPQAVALPAMRNGVVGYKIVYETLDLKHEVTRASGLLVVPDKNDKAYPIVSYQHGTTTLRTDVPSSGLKDIMITALVYGGYGYVVSAADYLGLGENPGFHPYLHADSEAWAAADMLRATKQAIRQLHVKLNSQLFLAGYSQGGHATMALHRHLEQDLAGEFHVTASAPMAGPYDLSETTVQEVIRHPATHSTAEMVYLIKAMNMIYGLSSSLDAFLKPELAPTVDSLFDGLHSLDALVAELPKTPTEILQPQLLTAILSRTNPPLIQALHKNDVYDWRPRAPVRLYQGKADQEVPYRNSIIAAEHMKALGADVEIVNVGDTLNHATAALPSFEQSLVWFETFKSNFFPR